MNSPFILKFNAIKRFLMTEQEKETSWTLFNFPNSWARQQVQWYLKNYICYFRNSISPWTGPQTKTIFWSFFLGMIHTMTTKKSASSEPPFRLFYTFVIFLAIFTLSTLAENILAKNLGHNLHKKCKIVSFRSSLSEKQPSTFGHFLHVLKSYWTP